MAVAVHTTETPTNANEDNGAAITTGVGFTVNATKSVAGVGFYVPGTNTGTYTVGLYQSTTDDDPAGTGAGTQLATASIGSAFVTPGTWAEVTFGSPVSCSTGIAYRAAVHSSSGRYVASVTGLSSPKTGNGVTLYANGADPVGLGSMINGVFNVGAALAYPSDGFGSSDYFVDIVLAGASNNDAVLGGSLPALAGSLTGDQQYDAVIAGALATFAGVFTGDQQDDLVLAGTIPALAGVVTGDVLNDAVLAGQLPALGGVLFEDVINGVISGALPGLDGTILGDNDLPPVVVNQAELDAQRRITLAFIEANPTAISLVPRTRYRTGTGAWKWQIGTPRGEQVMRVIEQGPPEVLTTQDGVQRRIDYVLLGTWDAQVAKGDIFTYADDPVEVIEVYHHNGYEVRAALIRRLDPP